MNLRHRRRHLHRLPMRARRTQFRLESGERVTLLEPRTDQVAKVWPDAQEFGFPDELSAFGLQFGHGLGLALHERPIISRVVSMDHPTEIKEGMVFALETQHGKMLQWGVRIEEMLIVHKDKIEIVSNFPVEQICVVNPMPGYSTLAGR